MNRFMYLYKKRIDLQNDNRLIIQTGSGSEIMKDVKAVSYINGIPKPIQIVKNDLSSVKFIYRNAESEFHTEYNLIVDIPNRVNDVKIVLTKDTYPAGKEEIRLSALAVRQLRTNLEFCVDSVVLDNGILKVTGWCAASKDVDIHAYNGSKALKSTLKRFKRDDIARMYLPGEISEHPGYEIRIQVEDAGSVKLIYNAGKKRGVRNIDLQKAEDGTAAEDTISYISRARAYITRYGMRRFLQKVYHKLKKQEDISYHHYFMKNFPSAEILQQQRDYTFEKNYRFSFLIPVFRPDKGFFTKMLQSIEAQTYDNWQLCIADGGGTGHFMEKCVKPFIKKYGSDKIKYVKLEENLGIAANTNAAFDMADGDFIVFGDHDDEFHPSALFECMRELEKEPDADFIYTDEDKIVGNTGKHITPHFKSDFNLEMLRHVNYICHMVTVKRTLADQVGRLISEYDGAQDFDYVLRCVEQAKNIRHIDQVLYYWRIHEKSTAMAPSAKNYANEAGKKAVAAHLSRMGIKGQVRDGIVPGFYQVDYDLEIEPLVSIIIPNKDHVGDLDKCICSIENNSTYHNVEYIIIENNSTEKETFMYYKELERDPKFRGKVKVVYYKGDFNYSAINNFGVQAAKGEYLLLLNNDTEIIEPDTIKSMLSFCQRKEVGIVGAKLLYEDDTVQHGGVVIGFQGVAGHAFIGAPDVDYGFFGRAVIAQELSAVTAACLMTKKSVFLEAGGLDERLKVAFNDIDFCLSVRKAGYKVIYDPQAKLHHYESKSRGLENTPEKIERFNSEIIRFSRKWVDVLDAGDPYYNSNLALDRKAYLIKDY